MVRKNSNGDRNDKKKNNPRKTRTSKNLRTTLKSGGGAGSARDRFNRRNSKIIALKRLSELIAGRKYQVLALERTSTRYGLSVRCLLRDADSPSGKTFVFLPARYRDMTDKDLEELNTQADGDEKLHLVFKGKAGKADMVDLI